MLHNFYDKLMTVAYYPIYLSILVVDKIKQKLDINWNSYKIEYVKEYYNLRYGECPERCLPGDARYHYAQRNN